MAANLFQPSLTRALDANGNPLNAAKMYFYATGTTTPATWYTNQAGTVAGTNPLTSNSAGMFQPAFLDPDTTYRIVLKTSDGATTIWDVDPVRGFDETQLVDDAAAATVAAANAILAQADAEAAKTAAETAQAGAEAALTGATAAAAFATDYYPGARSYVPQGAVTGAATISTAGSGGTNGTFDLAFSGGNFAVNPTGTFTVSGGAVTAITITGPGLYIGNAISKPTLSFAASSGLTGAAGTFNTVYLKTAGQYYLTDHASDTGKVSLFQNQANAAVEVNAAFDPFSVGAATNAVGAVQQDVEFALQPDAGVVEGAWYGRFFVPTDTDYTLIRHWIYSGTGTCDIYINVNDVNVEGPIAVTSTSSSDVIALSVTAGSSVAFQIENITGSIGGIAIQLEGLPA